MYRHRCPDIRTLDSRFKQRRELGICSLFRIFLRCLRISITSFGCTNICTFGIRLSQWADVPFCILPRADHQPDCRCNIITQPRIFPWNESICWSILSRRQCLRGCSSLAEYWPQASVQILTRIVLFVLQTVRMQAGGWRGLTLFSYASDLYEYSCRL